MANPVFHSQTSGSVTVGNEATSHTVTLPSSIATGDLLLLLVVTSHDFDDLSVSGWTRYSEFVVNGGLSSGCFFAVYAKTAGASESNPDITLGSSGLVSWICQRWSNAQFDNASSIYLDTIGSLSTTSDPSTPYPPSTSDDFYQLAVSFWADESDISSYPSGYGNTVSTASTVIGIGSATKLVSTIEDPGAFTLTDAVENVAAAFLIISLDAATGSGTVDGTGVLIGVGTTDRAGTGIISGIGDLDGIGHTDHSGTGTITCTGDISGIGDTDHRGTGVIPCTGELDGIGYSSHRGSGSILGTATITGIGSSGSDGTGIVAGTGILSGIGLSHYLGSGTISGTGSLSGIGDAPGIGPNMGSGIVSGTGTSSAIGYREPLGSGTISGIGSIVGLGPTTPGSGGKHLKCCCATLPDCIIAEDDFNRTNSTSLGSKWVEKTGDWEIDTNTLIAVSDGIVLTSARQGKPVGTKYNYNIEVDMLTGSVTSWGIICKYIDNNNFDWIDLTLDGSQLWPTFYRRSGGSDTVIMDQTTHPSGSSFSDVDQTLLICYSETEWSINYLGGDVSAAWTTCDVSTAMTLPADTSIGLVGFLKGHFDNFFYKYHRLSNPLCNVCDCYCQNLDVSSDYSCFPEILLLTLNPTAIYADCTSSPDPIEILLYQVETPPVATIPTTFSTAKQRWFSLDYFLPEWEENIRFEFVCNGTGGLPELNLYPEALNPLFWNALTLGVNASIVECNPIMLLFESLNAGLKQLFIGGPHICDPLSAAEYEAIITEAP